MTLGLFGKLPAKRDFVAFGMPREILGVWEPWLQGGISASRLKLGQGWQQAFLKAPIWRFWLGAEICGRAIAGAFMPSVDGVGRYFPLAVFAQADDGRSIPPPELEPQEEWFAALEDLLLSALDRDTTYEALTGALTGLRAPAGELATPPHEGLKRLSGGATLVELTEEHLANLLTAVRMENHAKSYALSTFWWTVGGEDFRPLAIAAHRMPDPHLYAGMLTGDFDGDAG